VEGKEALSRYNQPPPLEGLRREIARARERKSQGLQSGFVRETYRLNREEARAKAKEWFSTWPKGRLLDRSRKLADA
jgi:hypothetical protein